MDANKDGERAMTMQSESESARGAWPLAVNARAALTGAIARNRVLILLVAIHFVLTIAAGRVAGVPYDPGMFKALAQVFYGLMPLFLAVIVIYRFTHMLRHVRPERPLAWLASDLRALATTPHRVIDGIVTLVALSVLTGSFGYFKELIPYIVPFSWDPTFEHLDLVLHGGVLPDAWLLTILGNPYVVSLFNVVYQGWFFVMFLMIFVAVFTTGDRASRNTFLVGFVLAWTVGGNILATLYSSAGPVYYARLGFGDAYQGLMATLHAYAHVAPNWSLNVQEWLWNGYLGKGDIRGISAFPSMHAASTTVLMLYGWRRGRVAGRALTLFWGMICIAAVLLGWHYAVDVYAGIACGLAAWWGAARLTGDRAFRRAAPQVAAK